MIGYVNYLLIFFGFAILILIFIFPLSGSDAPFVRISTIFMAVFFIIPAFLFMYNGGYIYLGKFRALDDYALLNTLITFKFFLLGFLVVSQKLIKLSSGSGTLVDDYSTIQAPNRLQISKIRLIALAVIASSLFLVNEALRPDLETLYSIRRGTDQMSSLLFFLSSITNTLVMSLFFLLAAMRLRGLAIALVLFFIVTKLDASVGRSSLLLLLAVAGVFVFKIRASRAALYIPSFLFFGMPVILVGKEIIYSISTYKRMPDFSTLFQNLHDITYVFFQNFAHPFISMHEVFGILDITGYRWFYDVPQGFLFYLKVFGIDLGSSLSYYNTENLIGLHQSIVPTGYLAFGFVQASYLGALVMGVFFRYCFRFLSATALFNIAKSETLVFYISFVAANTFYTGEMRTLVLGFFIPVILMHLIGKFVRGNVD